MDPHTVRVGPSHNQIGPTYDSSGTHTNCLVGPIVILNGCHDLSKKLSMVIFPLFAVILHRKYTYI